MATEKKPWIKENFSTLLIGIIAAIIGFLGIMYAPGNYLIHPDFKIETLTFQDQRELKTLLNGTMLSDITMLESWGVSNNMSKTDNLKRLLSLSNRAPIVKNGELLLHDKISIQNIGWIQAKDVHIAVRGAKIISTDCPELILVKEKTIVLDRMSINLDCIIIVQSLNESPYTIVITAENSPAVRWVQQTKETTVLASSINMFIVSMTVVILVLLAIVTERRLKMRQSKAVYQDSEE